MGKKILNRGSNLCKFTERDKMAKNTNFEKLQLFWCRICGRRQEIGGQVTVLATNLLNSIVDLNCFPLFPI